jgi:DNA modification methylase
VRPAAYLFRGDARALPLADASIQCVVTSPPYWGLRDYGLGPETLGLEPTPELYVQHLVEIFREVRRVLRADATCWVNLGDSYVSNGRYDSDRSTYVGDLSKYDQRDPRVGARMLDLKPKDLVGIPWRVAFALQADGWYLRSDIIWAKPNPMPESVTDRPTKSHEYLFLLTKAARYYYDGEAIKEPHARLWNERNVGPNNWVNDPAMRSVKLRNGDDQGGGHYGLGSALPNPAGRNRRSVWSIATEPYPDAHFATFPEKLVEPCILAGTSARGACPACGAPWGRIVERGGVQVPAASRHAYTEDGNPVSGDNRYDPLRRGGNVDPKISRCGVDDAMPRATVDWSQTCTCPPANPIPCRVLDPFAGSGTTVAVAERLGRVGIGVELKPAYLSLARQRTVQMGLL